MKIKRRFKYSKDYILKIFMSFVSFGSFYLAFLVDGVLGSLFLLFMGFITCIYPYGLFYVFFVDKELELIIEDETLFLNIYENDICIKSIKIIKDELFEVIENVHYYNGVYNYMQISFLLKNKSSIDFKDGVVFSLYKQKDEIFHLINRKVPLKKEKLTRAKSCKNSYEKDFKAKNSMKIFAKGFLNRFNKFVKPVIIVFSILLINFLVNILSLKAGVFSDDFSNNYQKRSVNEISINTKREKIFFYDDYYYSVYKNKDNYYILKQFDFSLKSSMLSVYDSMDFNKVFEEIKHLKNAQDIIKNINTAVYRELEFWEIVFKPLFFINPKVDKSFLLSEKKRETFLEKHKKYLALQEKIKNYDYALKNLRKENKLIKYRLNKNDIKVLKEHFKKIHADLELNFISKKVSMENKYKKISNNFELVYKNKKISKKLIPNLYLVDKSTKEYTNIFPDWLIKRLDKLENDFKKSPLEYIRESIRKE